MEPTADCRAPRWGTWRSARSAPRAASWGRGERGAGWARCPEPLSPRMPRAGRGDTRGGQALSLHTALRCRGCHPAGSPHGTLLSFRLSSHGPGDVAAVGDGEEAAGTGVGAAMGCSLAPLPRNAPCFGRSAAQWDVQEDGGNPLDIEGGNGMESDIPHTRARLSRPQRRPFRSFICFALCSLSFPFGKVGALGPGLPAGEWDGAPSWFGCILVHPSQPQPYFPGGGRGGGGGDYCKMPFFAGGGGLFYLSYFIGKAKTAKIGQRELPPGGPRGPSPQRECLRLPRDLKQWCPPPPTAGRCAPTAPRYPWGGGWHCMQCLGSSGRSERPWAITSRAMYSWIRVRVCLTIQSLAKK